MSNVICESCKHKRVDVCMKLDGANVMLITHCKYWEQKEKKSNMEKVAEMFDVKTGEEFNLIKTEDPEARVNNPFWFEKEFGIFNNNGRCSDGIIVGLIGESYKIQKLPPKPWKPKKDEVYYFIAESGHITTSQFFARTFDYNNYNAGNCFKTKEEITMEITGHILKEMKEKYENGNAI